MGFTRRGLLAGIGSGSLALGGLSLGRGSAPFVQYTYSAPEDDTTDGLLRVAWYETYNDAFAENHAGTNDGLDPTIDPSESPAYVEEATYVTASSGPVLSVENVLPGDHGTLVVGLEVVDTATTSPVDVWFNTAVTADAENGVNEPEQVAGDATPADGELDDETYVEVWLDDSPLGSCDGIRNLDERLRTPVVPRAPVADAFGSTSDSGDADGLRIFDDCLVPGALRCVALSWDIPADAGNSMQGDTLGLDVAFAAGPCGGDSPFLVGGPQ
jgi:hypothetical protein